MLPSSLEQLRLNYLVLAKLHAEFQEAIAAYPLTPVDRLCLSLQELHYRIQRATLATELAVLLELNEQSTERLLATAIDRKVSFDAYWVALQRLSSVQGAA